MFLLYLNKKNYLKTSKVLVKNGEKVIHFYLTNTAASQEVPRCPRSCECVAICGCSHEMPEKKDKSYVCGFESLCPPDFDL